MRPSSLDITQSLQLFSSEDFHKNARELLTNDSNKIQFLIPENREPFIRKTIESLFKDNSLILNGNKKYHINTLINRFLQISKITSDHLKEEEKIAIEEYKLAIMTSLQVHLTRRYSIEAERELEQPAQSPWWIKAAGILFIVVGDIVLGSLGGFLGLQHIFEDFLPLVSILVRYLISAVLCGIDSLLAYSLMQSFIMKAVGASTVKETKSLAGIYEEQLKKMEIVNLALSNAKYYTQITAMEYQKYIALAGSFNQSLAATEIEEFKETTAKKTAKIIMLFIFLVLAVAGGYFLFKTFIVYIAGASFAATLVGAIIICTLTVYQAVARFSQRLHSIHELLYPNIEENIQAKEKLLTFKNKKQGLDDHFEYVLSEKLSNDINRKIIKESHVSMQAEKEESFQRRNVLHPQSIHSNSQDSNCEAKEMELVPLSKDAGEATEMKENKRRAFSSYSL